MRTHVRTNPHIYIREKNIKTLQDDWPRRDKNERQSLLFLWNIFNDKLDSTNGARNQNFDWFERSSEVKNQVASFEDYFCYLLFFPQKKNISMSTQGHHAQRNFRVKEYYAYFVRKKENRYVELKPLSFLLRWNVSKSQKFHSFTAIAAAAATVFFSFFDFSFRYFVVVAVVVSFGCLSSSCKIAWMVM